MNPRTGGVIGEPSRHERRCCLVRASQIDRFNGGIDSLKHAREIVDVAGDERRRILGREVGDELALLIPESEGVTKGQVKRLGRVEFRVRCRGRGRKRGKDKQGKSCEQGEKSDSHWENLLTRSQTATAAA